MTVDSCVVAFDTFFVTGYQKGYGTGKHTSGCKFTGFLLTFHACSQASLSAACVFRLTHVHGSIMICGLQHKLTV